MLGVKMDRFRKEYTPITDSQKQLVAAIKNKAEELEHLIGVAQNHDHRLGAIALTVLEESVMWAVKAATADISGAMP